MSAIEEWRADLKRDHSMNDCAARAIAELEAILRLACIELTEYERSDLEQSGTHGVAPLTPAEWHAALHKRVNEEKP